MHGSVSTDENTEGKPIEIGFDAIRDTILTSLDDDKAEDIVCINLDGKSSIADAMIVASGNSTRHVAALADHVAKKLKELGLGRVKIQGLPNADWVLIDAGDVIAHIFKPEVRAFYDIESIWIDNKKQLGKA